MSDLNYDRLPEPLKTISLKPLFAMRLTVDPLTMVGKTPQGTRRVGVITGGEFVGERLSGKILTGGSDWQVVHADGTITLNVRVVLQTHDGENICVTYQGFRHGDAAVIARLDQGQAVDPSEYYFRTNPLFETASKKYDWLNRVIAVGTGKRDASGPVYSVFEVL